MNPAGAVAMGFATGIIDESATLIGLPSQRSARQQLPGTIDDVVKAVAAVVETAISTTAEKKTAAEFNTAFNECFPVYFRSIVSLSVILQAAVPRQAIESVVNQSFCELESDFREHAMAEFGADIRDQAMFTVWTLRKITDLTNIIVSAGKLAEVHKEKDAEFASNYLVSALRARFSIDCLTHSMRTKRAIYPEVMGQVSDGLRAAVDAYAWIRRAVDLHAPQAEPEMPMLELDSEDVQLLKESMYDMAHEVV